jgi:hypothetical protein
MEKKEIWILLSLVINGKRTTNEYLDFRKGE